MTQNKSLTRKPKDEDGRNQVLSTCQTPINQVLCSERSVVFGEKQLQNDQSLLQLRDAIDVIIGKLDEKLGDTSRRHSMKSSKSPVPKLDVGGSGRHKARATSNDFTSKLRGRPGVNDHLLKQLGLKATGSAAPMGSKRSQAATERNHGDSMSSVQLCDESGYKTPEPMLTQEVPKTGNLTRYKYADAEKGGGLKRVLVRHKVGKTNSPYQHSNFSFKVKHSVQNSVAFSTDSRKATENRGDQGDCELMNRAEVISDDDDAVGTPPQQQTALAVHNLIRMPSSGQKVFEQRGATFQSARFPVTTKDSADILQTSFTEGDPNDRSTSGGGLEHEIRQIKSLLG